MPENRIPRRPAFISPEAMEALGGTYDPVQTVHLAHETAAVLVREGRSGTDPAVTARLVALVEEIGVEAVAELWSQRPARSLPGALWRLYALREWVRRSPSQASREYAAGTRFAQVQHVVAGAANPYGPQEITQLADTILAGVFTGDLAVALDRAAGFCAVVAAGRADLETHRVDVDELLEVAHEEPAARAAREAHAEQEARSRSVEAAAYLLETGRDLAACATLWREDRLE